LSNVLDVVDYFIMEMSYQVDVGSYIIQLTNNLQVSVTFIFFVSLIVIFNLYNSAFLFESTLSGAKK
jgi:hypothetical protein